jgi:hypothetical protein
MNADPCGSAFATLVVTIKKNQVFLNFFACRSKEGLCTECRSGSVHIITDLDSGDPALFVNISHTLDQCWGSLKFWCGSGSPDPYLWLMDPDPTPSFNEFKDLKKKISCFFLITYPQVPVHHFQS